MRDEREQAAHDKGLQYVGLDGFVGIIANGAGLAMCTVDIVNQVGGKPANFLDIGGGANADVMAGALEVINNDPNVRVDLHQHLRWHHQGRRGRQRHRHRAGAGRRSTSPIVIRLDGTNADEGRAILEPHLSDKLQIAPTMVEAAQTAVGAGHQVGRRSDMAIFVDETTKVVYQGLTGSQGRFYGLLNRDYGTQVVAGTNPKKAGTDVDGIPVYATVADAVEATGCHRFLHLHPRSWREVTRSSRPPRVA